MYHPAGSIIHPIYHNISACLPQTYTLKGMHVSVGFNTVRVIIAPVVILLLHASQTRKTATLALATRRLFPSSKHNQAKIAICI